MNSRIGIFSRATQFGVAEGLTGRASSYPTQSQGGRLLVHVGQFPRTDLWRNLRGSHQEGNF